MNNLASIIQHENNLNVYEVPLFLFCGSKCWTVKMFFH
ncbi:hypothetical protein [Enterococcus sp. DIV1420a]